MIHSSVELFELLLAAASKRDRESHRISVQTHFRITESIESDLLSHDRHASIKLYTALHSPSFDYRVRAHVASISPDPLNPNYSAQVGQSLHLIAESLL